jgi:hypothetical protein
LQEQEGKMSLRPRFSNSPGPAATHSPASGSAAAAAAEAAAGDTAAANQHNDATEKEHSHHFHHRRLLLYSASRHRLSILVLILLLTTASLCFFDLFAKLAHDDGTTSRSRKRPSSFVLQARALRGLLGVGHIERQSTIRNSPPTRQNHPRIVLYYLLDRTPINEARIDQRREEDEVVLSGTSLESSPRNTGTMVVAVEPMSTELEKDVSNTNERENKKDLGLADPLETKKCRAQYQWQLDSKPTCNALHEMDMGHLLDKKDTHGDYSAENVLRERVRLIANGGWRDVWGLIDDDYNDINNNTDRYVVLKTLLYPKEVVPRNVERHRRDAMAMERLTSSPNIVDIYAFCGNSGLFEFAKGGDLEAAVHTLAKSLYTNGQLTHDERLQRLQLGEYDLLYLVSSGISKRKVILLLSSSLTCEHFAPLLFRIIEQHTPTGVQAAMGLADLHNFDQEGRPSVAHTDISLNQFVKIDGRFKLNDFNRVS